MNIIYCNGVHVRLKKHVINVGKHNLRSIDSQHSKGTYCMTISGANTVEDEFMVPNKKQTQNAETQRQSYIQTGLRI